MEEHTEKQPESCKGSVMERIACGDVCPRSKVFFKTREYLVWFLWGLSVVLGALAVAVALFVVSYQKTGMYLHHGRGAFDFFISSLPFLWVGVLVAMVLLAVFHVRHTKRGYRYPLWILTISSLVLSFAGGAVLHLLGVGKYADYHLGQNMRMYTSQEKMEKKLWHAPLEGRLIGVQQAVMPLPIQGASFTDIFGDTWELDTTELTDTERAFLAEGTMVRLTGTTTDMSLRQFYVCAVLPWLHERGITKAEFERASEMFSMKLNRLKTMASDQALPLEEKTVCTKMTMTKGLLPVPPLR
jgi:hypothetical protein